MKGLLKKISFNNELFYSIVLLLVPLLLTIGFSAFSASLDISDIGVVVRVNKDIRVTDVVATNATGNAISNYEDYNTNSITSSVSLPNNNSSITYRVVVTNIGNVEMGLLNISGLPSNLTYSISNYNLKDTLCDDNNSSKCKLGSVSTLDITVGYASNGYNSGNIDYLITLNFDFKRVFTITYSGFSSTAGLPSSILENDTKTITFTNTTGIPYDVAVTNATGSYNNPVLSLSNVSDNIVINRYYHITYILNGGTNSNNNPDKFLSTSTINLSDPSYNGNIFDGWYENGSFTGNAVSSISNRSSDVTLYAKWTPDVVQYNITYNLNGGTQASNQVTSYYESTPQNILEPENTHDATFDGWYDNSGFTGTEIISTSQLSGNATLYAKWIGEIPNTTFSTTNNRFTASGVSSVGLRDFTRAGSYEYTQSSANTTINSVKVYITYTSSNKSSSLTCQVAGSRTSTGTISLSTNQNNATAEGTITMATAIQPGSSYTVSCSSYSGDNNGKIKVNGFAFLVNP